MKLSGVKTKLRVNKLSGDSNIDPDDFFFQKKI